MSPVVTVRRPHAFVPGPGGYVIAVAIGWAICAVGLVVPDLGEYDVSAWIPIVVVYVPLLTVACASYGLPVAVVGVTFVHVLRRWGAPFPLQVAVTAVVLAGLTHAWLVLTLPGGLEPDGGRWSSDGPWLPALVGGAAAIGHLVARRWLPPVHSCRRRLALRP
ncbi:MAG: hypothetical protein JWQ74_1980 [Marmoricola sp.]|nr:hypothetical protein [Marmoricola sp.]